MLNERAVTVRKINKHLKTDNIIDWHFGIIVFFNFIHCCFLAVKLHHPHPHSQQQ